jgi:putative Holliday junction resolvase
MRVLGVDFGQRRIGLAVSDASGILARPWRGLAAGSTPDASAATLASVITSGLEADLEGLAAIVVGLPGRLGGGETDQTEPARRFAATLGRLTGLPVHLQDERLSSYEAERRLAERERDWRRRKAKLDAAAAAVILQDYLDGPRVSSGARD